MPFKRPALALLLLALAACSGESPQPVPSEQPQPLVIPSPQPTPGTAAGAQIENIVCGPYSATDNILTNGDFEAPSVDSSGSTTFAAGAGFTNWKVDLGSVAVVKGSIPKASGTQAVALGGTLSQQVTTIPGKTYQLSLCYATTPGATSGGLAVNWEGQPATTLALNAAAATSAPAWQGVRLTLVARTNRAIVALNGAGSLVDTVKLTLVP